MFRMTNTSSKRNPRNVTVAKQTEELLEQLNEGRLCNLRQHARSRLKQMNRLLAKAALRRQEPEVIVSDVLQAVLAGCADLSNGLRPKPENIASMGEFIRWLQGQVARATEVRCRSVLDEVSFLEWLESTEPASSFEALLIAETIEPPNEADL